MVAVTSNFFARQSSFRESSFVFTQANYRKLQKTVKRKWNKRIFLISNLQIPIHFLLSHLVSHENEMLVVWLTVNSMRPQQTLLFLFYVKKYFRIKKKRRQKPMTQLINQVLFSFEMRKYASFAEMNMILMTITKAQLLSFDSWNMRYPPSKLRNSYLLKNFTLTKALFFLVNKFLPVMCFFFLYLAF